MGIYTEIDLKEKKWNFNNEVGIKRRTSPNYTTRTETYYAANGTTVNSTVVYTRSYDADGNLSGEVMN